MSPTFVSFVLFVLQFTAGAALVGLLMAALFTGGILLFVACEKFIDGAATRIARGPVPKPVVSPTAEPGQLSLVEREVSL